MTTQLSATSTGFGQEAFAEFLSTRDEPDWVTELRRNAYDVYQEKLGEPLDPEEWKRIELRTFRPGKFAVRGDSGSTASFETLMQDRADFAGAVSHVNGSCSHSNLKEELGAKGILFGNLAELIREHGEELRPHLQTRAVKSDTDRFSAWHAAFWTGGTVLYVPRGVRIDEPLYSLIALSEDYAADFSHTLIILEEGASATLLEETASANGEIAGLHVGAVELLVAREARLRYVQLQNWNHKTWHFAHQAGIVENNASLQWTVGGLGAKLAHIHQDVNLEGRGAEAEVNGLTFAVSTAKSSRITLSKRTTPPIRGRICCTKTCCEIVRA